MPSQSEVRKRRIRAENTAAGRAVRGGQPRRRRRRLLVGAVAVIVAVMMVASLAVGLFASGI